MNKYLPKIIFITLYSNLSFAEQLLNQELYTSTICWVFRNIDFSETFV